MKRSVQLELLVNYKHINDERKIYFITFNVKLRTIFKQLEQRKQKTTVLTKS